MAPTTSLYYRRPYNSCSEVVANLRALRHIKNDMNSTLKLPSALIPIVMSLLALAIVVGHALKYGIVHEADEGAAAHIFQLLMVLQIPVVVFFAMKWLPRAPREALLVLALQGGAALAAFAAVFFLT